MRVSCSRIQTVDDCGIKYDLRYNQRLTSVARPFALFYGTVVDRAISAYVFNHALGQSFDVLARFEECFDEEIAKNQITYPQHWDADVAREAGRIHCDKFPDVWEKSNLVAVIDAQGVPVVQRRIIAPLPQNHELEMILDFLVMDTDTGSIGPLDLKTTSAKLPPESPFGLNSFQLTTQQYGVDYEFGDYLGSVSNVGFMELVKRKPPKSKGKGPTVEMPEFYPRRNEEQLNDMLRTYVWRANAIANKQFSRPTNGAFNSPCQSCEFARLCTQGDTQGIITRSARKVA